MFTQDPITPKFGGDAAFAAEDLLQINGLCRFSYPTAKGSGFTHKAATPQSFLYDRKRLERRLMLFEHFCLPSLTAQKDNRFQMLILIGEELPAFALKKLRKLTDDLPNIILHQAPEGRDHSAICQEVFHHHRDLDLPFTAEFNMDDDDALGCNFTALLHRKITSLTPLIQEEGHIEVDFARGFAGQLKGDNLRIKHILAPHWGLAQAFMMPTESPLTAAHFHHMRHWRRNSCLTLNSEPMFLRLFHGDNDSGTSWDKLQLAEPRRHEPPLLQNIQNTIALDLARWHVQAIESD